MRYVILTFSGYSFPIARQLLDEGQEVLVGQIGRAKADRVRGWEGQPEEAEYRRRRLALYDGLLPIQDADDVLRQLQFEADKGRIKDTFVWVDHNNLHWYGERVAQFGYTGFLPLQVDYERERNRQAAHAFVKKHYAGLKVLEGTSLKKAADGIQLVQDSDHPWVLKSNGNFGATIVPKVKDLELNHREIVGALTENGADYEAGGYLLERQLLEPVEFTAVLGFWNGKPLYSHVELESKPIGAGDLGFDGGGAVNGLLRTDLEAGVNQLCFPPAVMELAAKRKGLFLFDAGVLYEPASGEYYFTEFCGNRWGWGGVFSELALAGGPAAYFEALTAGRNPLEESCASTVTLYNLLPDEQHPTLHEEHLPVYWKTKYRRQIHLYQVRKDRDRIVNVGLSNSLLGYCSGAADSLESSAESAYRAVEAVSFKELLYRPKSDYLSTDYATALLRRRQVLQEQGLLD